jgi:hypothetical protein
LIVSTEVFIFAVHYACIFLIYCVTHGFSSRFPLRTVTWFVMSNKATLKCSRPDSKGGDGSGRYLMLPEATESAKGRG